MRVITLVFTAVLAISLVSGLAYAQEQAIFNKNYRPMISSRDSMDHGVISETRFFVLKDRQQPKKNMSFWGWLNSKLNPRQNSEEAKVELRRQWHQTFGVDVFLPYFKLKQAQELVKDKTSVNFFNMKGRAEFNEENKNFEYIFKKRF